MLLAILTVQAMTAPQLDALFLDKLGAQTHFTHGGKVAGKRALDAATVRQLQLGPGEWFPAGRVELSATVTAYAALERRGSVTLVLVERASAKVTDVHVVADFSRLEGSYEKSTSAWLRAGAKGVTLTVLVSLRDFEFEDPGVPGTRNISGDETRGFELRGTKFERVSR